MFAPTASAQHKASPVEMMRLAAHPPPGASPSRFEQEQELRALLEEATQLERSGHVMQSLAVRERALLVQYTQALGEIEAQTATGSPNNRGNLHDPAVRPIVEAAIKRARTLVLQLNAAAVRLFKADDFDSAGQLLAAAVRICDSSDNYSYFFDHWEQRVELKATTFNNLGCMERRRGRLAVALQYLRQALELPSTPSAALHLNVSGVLAQLGKDSEAMYAARKAIAVADQPPTADQQVFPGLRAVARHNLATMLERTDIDAAVKTAAEAVALAEKELGAASPTTVPIRQTFNRLQTIMLKRQQEDLLAIEAEREAAERAREIALAEESRRAQNKKRRGGGGGPSASSSTNVPFAQVSTSGAQVSTTGKGGLHPLPSFSSVGGAQKGDGSAAEGAAGNNAMTASGGEQQPQKQQLDGGGGVSGGGATATGAQQVRRSPVEIQAEQDSFQIGGAAGPRRAGGFVGAVRKVPDTTAKQQPASSNSREGSASRNEAGTPSAITSPDEEDPTSTRAQSEMSRSDRLTAAAQRIEEQRNQQLLAAAGVGGGSGASGGGKSGTAAKPSFGSPHSLSLGSGNVSGAAASQHLGRSVYTQRTIATEEAALNDVVNFLSHRLATLLRVEETDTKRFAAARCIQCAMRVALAKNELSRRREKRILATNRQLAREKEAAHLITSFFLRLRERRRQHMLDRQRAAAYVKRKERAAITIQSRVRIWSAQRLLVKMRGQRSVDDQAATIIQRQMRRCLAHSMVQRLRATQAKARFERFGLERLEYAANLICRAYKRHRARTVALLLKGDFAAALSRDWRAQRNHSAIIIQRYLRGYCVRKAYTPILREKNKLRKNREFTRRRIDASKLLQAVGRAWLTARGPMRRLYPDWKKLLAAQRANVVLSAVVIIQRLFRCARARRRFVALKEQRDRKKRTLALE